LEKEKALAQSHRSLTDRLKVRALHTGIKRCAYKDHQLQLSSNHYCVVQCASARRVVAIVPSVSHPALAVQTGLLSVVGDPVDGSSKFGHVAPTLTDTIQ
jgi:hypothetical protein